MLEQTVLYRLRNNGAHAAAIAFSPGEAKELVSNQAGACWSTADCDIVCLSGASPQVLAAEPQRVA